MATVMTISIVTCVMADGARGYGVAYSSVFFSCLKGWQFSEDMDACKEDMVFFCIFDAIFGQVVDKWDGRLMWTDTTSLVFGALIASETHDDETRLSRRWMGS